MDICSTDEINRPSPKRRRLNPMTQPTALDPQDDDMDDLYADAPSSTLPNASTPSSNTIVAAVLDASPNQGAAFALPGIGAGADTAMMGSDDKDTSSTTDDGDRSTEASTVTGAVKMEPQFQNNSSQSAGESIATGSNSTVQDNENFSSDSRLAKVEDSNGTQVAALENGQGEHEAMAAAERMNVDGQQAADGGAEWEVDSSPYESSSEDSSDSSSDEDSDDDSDDSDEYVMMDPAEQARRLMEDDGLSDDEGNKKGGTKGAALKTHNERPEEIVAKPDITVTPDMKIEELGTVELTVESMALIKAKVSGEYQVLEMDSLLCLADRKVIGVVAETLGRVQEPLYCVRFTNAKTMEEDGVSKGVTIYYVPGYSSFVFTKALQSVKGSDASNVHDEEVGAEEMEFSDDEAEAEYKRNIKLQKQAKKAGVSVDELAKSRSKPNGRRDARRERQAQHGPASISYDDTPGDDGELYTPLTRPTNIQEMMARGGPAAEYPLEREGYSRPPQGRGRGDRSGRGDRGRRDRGPGGRGRGDRKGNSGAGRAQRSNGNLDLSLPPTPKFTGTSSAINGGMLTQPLPASPPFVGQHANQYSYQPPSQYHGNQFQLQPAQGQYAGPQWPNYPPQQQQPSPQQPLHYPFNPSFQPQPGQYSGQYGQGQPVTHPLPPLPPPPQQQQQQQQQHFQAGAAINPAFFAQFQQSQNQRQQSQPGQGGSR